MQGWHFKRVRHEDDGMKGIVVGHKIQDNKEVKIIQTDNTRLITRVYSIILGISLCFIHLLIN